MDSSIVKLVEFPFYIDFLDWVLFQFIVEAIILMKNKFLLLTFFGVFPFIISQPVQALEVKTIWKIPYVSFSVHGEYLRNPDGTIWTNPTTGEPKYEIKFDPPPVNGVTQIRADVSFDPTRLEILTDPSTYGFLCEFSTEKICPPHGNTLTSVTYGSPIVGSSYNFSVDNILGRAIFEYDLSNVPVDILQETDFFAFQAISKVGLDLSEDDFVQNTNQQYCRTVVSGDANGCGTIPTPTAVLPILTGIIGTAIRKPR